MSNRIQAAGLAGLLAVAALVGGVGCSSDSAPVVSGEVTLDGRPLASGVMQFLPEAGDAPSEASRVAEGKFSAKLQRTKYAVQIYAPREVKTGAKLDENGPGGGPTMEETLPPRYNLRSNLKLDVTGPKDDVRFELTSR